MNFELSDIQSEIRNTVSRLMQDKYDFAARQKMRDGSVAFSKEMWQEFAELGLLGIGFDEDLGGVGGGFMDVCVVTEAFGQALLLEPFLANTVLAGGVLAKCSSAKNARDLCAKIASGDLLVALAHSEFDARYTMAHVDTQATQRGDSFVLRGKKNFAIGGDVAQKFIVSARTSGEPGDPQGISLFLVDRDADGVSVRNYRTFDDLGAAEIVLNDAPATLISAEGEASALLEEVTDKATAAVCAEAVGAMQAALDLTVDYIKTRKQFGRTIGSFQVIQHKAVDMLAELEHARALALIAANFADETDTVERARAISAAKIGIDKCANILGELAIQLHGGIGVTEEYAIGHYFRRLTAIGLSFGDADYHVSRQASLNG